MMKSIEIQKKNRWHLAGLDEAISWCRACNERGGITCRLHPPLGEFAEDQGGQQRRLSENMRMPSLPSTAIT
ncbi:hypothetical protein [Methanogenium cariaci]|uniref:hypothetical protein n=1 Tax=Methanogenium cariaci TaxID=2197 RepID=UPI000781DD0A|nr:hypothetical protein [Methanogenium cariaci]